MRIVGSTKQRLQLKINIPPDCIVAKYVLHIKGEDREIYEHKHPVIILFNPWCEGRYIAMILLTAFSVFMAGTRPEFCQRVE